MLVAVRSTLITKSTRVINIEQKMSRCDAGHQAMLQAPASECYALWMFKLCILM